ncbi:hypothetical protein ABBQ38_002981 [Trebouxia sp. C0009 RCD-2024]
MSIEAPQHFERRVDAVFGALDSVAQPSNQSATGHWSLARQQVFRAGKGEADSSEGEDEEEQHAAHLTSNLLDSEDGNVQVDQQGNIVQPSLAFCQALDNEQEYDEVDAVAGTSLRGVADPADLKPSRFTEVLDDNVFEQRMKSHASASPSTATLMDVDTLPAAQPPNQHASLLWGNRTEQGSHRRPPLTGRRPGRGHSRSYVPLHVKHPEKYTCYVLDEPLLVGGGDRGADATSGKSEQEKAARAASSAAVAAQQHMQQEEAKEPLPAFGSGMQFRPTKKVKQQGSSQAPQRSAAVSNRDDEMEADDGMHDEMEDADMQPVTKPRLIEATCMDDDFGEGAKAAAIKPRRRQYRVKSNLT